MDGKTISVDLPDGSTFVTSGSANPTATISALALRVAKGIIATAKASGDSWGGSIELAAEGLPLGLGEPVFGKLKGLMAGALASIGAVTGVSWGDLAGLDKSGRAFHQGPEAYGGIQGGLSNGEPRRMRVWCKPPATLGDHALGGRHDPCILPRAVPVVEAMATLVLADLWLAKNARPHQS